MKKLLKRVLFIVSCFPLLCNGQQRNEILIPNLDGYITLKCDFHIHTVFSDGLVWPTVRADEAYREGLSAIALTEHVEYRPHKKDVSTDLNRSYEICKKEADFNGVNLIRGAEITRSMAPGHFNAIFLNDCNALDRKEWRDAFKEAKSQNAFIFWNHPGWSRQQPDTTLWWKEHTEIYKNGWMQGIEVANGGSYFPEAHQWCIDKNLTMLGNSDIHQPINMDYDFSKGEHRTMTLVLAKENSIKGIREALDNHRTIVYVKEKLIGKEEYLRELFEKSIKITNIKRGKKSCQIILENKSGLSFDLVKSQHKKEIEYFRTFNIKPNSRSVITVYFPENDKSQEQINFVVSNLMVKPNQGLNYNIKI